MQTAPTEPVRDALSTLRIDRSQKHSPHQSGRRRRLIYVVVVIVMGLGGFWAASSFGVISNGQTGFGGWFEIPDVLKNRPEVRVERPVVESGRSADATVVATGYLESRRQAKIGARAPGRIQSVTVEEGTRVKKDEVLAVLEHADLDASLAATEANLARSLAAIEEQQVLIQQSQREYDRGKNLHRTRSISDAEFDETIFRYETAVARMKSMKADVQLSEARLKEAQQLRENMFIRAPFDGTVISKDAEVGESILPGGMGEASGRGSAVTIADLDNLEVECDVKEDYIGRVRPGQRTEVAVDAVSDHRYHGQVRKVIPMGDRARATIKVKVTITDADDRLFPEMSSTVYFLPEESASDLLSKEPRTFCSEQAIMSDQQGDYVWVLDDKDHAQQLRVSIGKRRDGRVEVLSGLTGDEQVIVNPPVDLKMNQPVKISE